MAGFFGLFNYEKEGPGIRKDGPKKKTFIVFLETFFRNFWKFIPINLFYGLLSLPLVTGGLSSAGLTNVTRNIARDKHSFGLSDFWDTVRKNWKQALAVGILRVLCVFVLGYAFWFYAHGKGLGASIGIGMCLCLSFIFAVMNFFVWTLMITFKFSVGQILKNSFRFVFLNMKRNLLCGIILLLTEALYVAIPFLFFHPLVLTLLGMLYLCTFPAFRYLLIQYCTFPSIQKYIIDPYYAEHPDEDIERRRDLGLEVEDPNAPETDEESEDGEEDPDAPVFED